jgi:hypothetical protein
MQDNDLTRISEAALKGALTRIEAPSGALLSDAESAELTVLLDQLAAHYPHQTLTDETGEIWREAYQLLAKRYTIRRLRDAMVELMVRPGQKFFPHPTEAAEALDNLIAKERAATAIVAARSRRAEDLRTFWAWVDQRMSDPDTQGMTEQEFLDTVKLPGYAGMKART